MAARPERPRLEMLRHEGYRGHLTMISADDSVPYDRPALSKDFLNGTASKKLVPLHSPDFYRKHEIELLLNTRVAAIDPRDKSLQLVKGSRRKFDALPYQPVLMPGRKALTARGAQRALLQCVEKSPDHARLPCRFSEVDQVLPARRGSWSYEVLG